MSWQCQISIYRAHKVAEPLVRYVYTLFYVTVYAALLLELVHVHFQYYLCVLMCSDCVVALFTLTFLCSYVSCAAST